MKKNLAILFLTLSSATAVLAGTESKAVETPAPEPVELFRAHEFQVDTSFAAALGRYSDRSAHGLGGNLGLNYFFTRYFGIGIDNSLGGAVGAGSIGGVFYSLQADLIARYPIESLHLAPYAFAGGGGTWGNYRGQGNGNVGGGIEYRINRNIGTFLDSRYIYGNDGLNQSLTRVGFRFAF
jgi:hypothetical protein